MRVFLIVVAALLALVVGVLFAAPLFVDAASYRSDIESIASDALGQPVRVNGELSFRVLPTPRLAADKIEVAPPAGLSDLMPPLTVRKAEIVFSLAELVGGKLVAHSIVLDNPEIAIHRDLAGHRNVKSIGGRSIGSTGVTLRNGTLRLIDEQRGRRMIVDDVNGTIGEGGAFSAMHGSMTARIGDQPVALEFRATAAERPALSLEFVAENLAVMEFKGRVTPGAGWRADGELSVRSTDVRPMLTEVLPTDDLPNGIPASAAGRVSLQAGRVNIEAISGMVADAPFGGRLSIVDGDRVQVDTALSFEQLDGVTLAPWMQRLASDAVDGDLVSPDEFPISARMQFDAGLIAFPGGFVRQASFNGSYEDGMLQVERVAALLPGGSDVAYSGQVRLAGGAFRLDGAVELASDNLAALLQSAGLPIRSEGHGRLRNLGLSARLMVDGAVAQVSGIDLRFDQSRVTGGLAIALVRRPSFSANLSIDQFNANAYAGLVEGETDPSSLLFTDGSQLSLPWLKAFDTNTNLKVGRLIIGGTVTRGITLESSLINSVLDIKNFAIADLDGGSISLTGRVDTPDNPQWLLQGELSTQKPPRFFAGRAGRMVPSLLRLQQVSTRFRIEGGAARSAVQADLMAPEFQAEISGLVSNALEAMTLDIDIELSASRSGRMIALIFPDWKALHRVPGPLDASLRFTGGTDLLTLGGRIDAASARLELNGDVRDMYEGAATYDLALRLRHGDFKSLIQSIESDYLPAEVAVLPLDASVHVRGDSNLSEFSSMVVTAGENRLKGEILVDWKKSKPAVDVSLTDLQLDIDGFLVQHESGAAFAAQRASRAFRWSRLPLEWPWMNTADLTGRFSFDQVRVLGLTLRNGTLEGVAGAGGWSFSDLKSDLEGGRIEGGFDVALLGIPRLRVDMAVRNIGVQVPLASFLGGALPLDGEVSADIRLQGEGLTEFDLARSLSGEIDILKETRLRWPSNGRLENISGRIAVTGGVFRASPRLVADAEPGGGAIAGSVDLGDWIGDFEVRGPDNGPITLVGPLHDLEIRSR